MSSALDMSLEDIIKAQRGSNSRRGNSRGNSRGNTRSSGGPARNTRQSHANKPYQQNMQQYRAAPVAALHTATIRQSVPDGSKMQVSNLDFRVTAEDLKLVFSSRVGPLKKCTLNYDQNGKSTGTALVHFTRVGDASVAYQRFNGVPLDGKPMKIEILTAPVAPAPAPVPQQHAPRHTNNPSHQQRGGRGGAPRRGGRGGGRTSGPREVKKTADQLDAEMNDYMQVDA
ncbi:hypothetical protein DFQ27_008989 [Actinomortierella ambigua]|uniref:RRM domain-containing protein n=1 Tax=Actinomortierella ambigua TaxID=1343610 RepID=A0A9P6QHD2_9FUNG|nr:hypothetical protein DFQ26_005339 [Actinomortierella ambigua]KAG0267208.1 hypothetical protein DFQ27_008989 [Actinomortierella ambigua]